MTSHSNATRSVTINFRLTRASRGEVDAWAETEDRTRSDMARILLEEALASRAKKRRPRSTLR